MKEIELYGKDKSTKGIRSKKKYNGQNIVILYIGIFKYYKNLLFHLSEHFLKDAISPFIIEKLMKAK